MLYDPRRYETLGPADVGYEAPGGERTDHRHYKSAEGKKRGVDSSHGSVGRGVDKDHRRKTPSPVRDDPDFGESAGVDKDGGGGGASWEEEMQASRGRLHLNDNSSSSGGEGEEDEEGRYDIGGYHTMGNKCKSKQIQY